MAASEHDDGGRETGRRRGVRRLFVALLVLLALQYLMILYVVEPYPAVMMPEFRGELVNGAGMVEFEVVETRIDFADGGREAISLIELVAGKLPEAHVGIVAARCFAPHDEPTGGAASDGARHQTKRKLRDWLGLGLRNPTITEPSAATRAWLRDAIAQRFPEREPVAITFRWWRVEVDPASPTMQRVKTPIGERTLELGS